MWAWSGYGDRQNDFLTDQQIGYIDRAVSSYVPFMVERLAHDTFVPYRILAAKYLRQLFTAAQGEHVPDHGGPIYWSNVMRSTIVRRLKGQYEEEYSEMLARRGQSLSPARA